MVTFLKAAKEIGKQRGRAEVGIHVGCSGESHVNRHMKMLWQSTLASERRVLEGLGASIVVLKPNPASIPQHLINSQRWNFG